MRIACYVLHYGKEHLAWSIRSIQDHVDEIHVFYTDRPSFGHGSSLTCPETEDELKIEANRFITKPLFWHRGRWSKETDHRNEINRAAAQRGAGTILVVDADEMWDASSLEDTLNQAESKPERNFLVPFVHLWRSFAWCCDDPCMPVRVIRPGGSGDGYIRSRWPVFHLGYAQTANIVRYKESIHGHKSEWRKGWFENRFLAWSPSNAIADVHPTNLNFWTPKPIDPERRSVLQEIAGDHPFFSKEVI